MSFKKIAIGALLLIVLVVVVLGLILAFDKEARDDFAKGWEEARKRQQAPDASQP